MRSHASAGALYEFSGEKQRGLTVGFVRSYGPSTLLAASKVLEKFMLLQPCVSHCDWWLSLFECRAMALQLGHGVNLIGAIEFAWNG